MDWSALPVVEVPLERLVWPCHDIDPAHVHPAPGLQVSCGPIHVETLVDGSLFVHDGRHRAVRATLAGQTHLPARVLPRADVAFSATVGDGSVSVSGS